jgi:hypothetical protein
MGTFVQIIPHAATITVNGVPKTVHQTHQNFAEIRDLLMSDDFDHTPGGLRIAICPATYLDVTCVECQVCSRPRVNGTVMGFPTHANRSAYVDAIFMKDGSSPNGLPDARLVSS